MAHRVIVDIRKSSVPWLLPLSEIIMSQLIWGQTRELDNQDRIG